MTYMGSGDPDPQLTDYYPEWLDNLANDVTLEAPAMNGSAHGAEAVRAIVVEARKLYEFQDFNFTGHYGDDGFLVAFADGSVRFISGKVTPQTLNATFTRNGGEVVGKDL